MKQNNALTAALVTVALLATGAAAYYIGSAPPSEKPVQTAAATQPIQQAQLPPCDDKNIVGMATGAVAGGVLGNQIGKGSGKTAATVGGAVVGGVAGQKLIPTQNVTCR